MSQSSRRRFPRRCTQQTIDLTEDDPGDSVTQTTLLGATLDEASYICSQCGRTLDSYSQYTKHQKMHDTAVLCKCHECGLGFTTIRTLILHQRSHLAKAVYMCPECSKTFIYKSHLKEHRDRYHGANRQDVPDLGT